MGEKIRTKSRLTDPPKFHQQAPPLCGCACVCVCVCVHVSGCWYARISVRMGDFFAESLVGND